MGLDIQHNISLKPYNTFGLDVRADNFVRINSAHDFIDLKKNHQKLFEKGLFILGGGSNVLLTHDVSGLVIKNEILGIEKVKESDEFVWLEAGGGVVWHDFVQFTVDNHWAGLENLSLIPGTVGAAPMQNIGAYGVEIKDCFESLDAVNINSLEIEKFNGDQCQFGYRESYFKRAGKGQYLITKVCFKLRKKAEISTSYGAIQEVLRQKNISNPGIKDVSQAIIEIRKSKLPDPKDIGNSGSFFKNPTVPKELADKLKLNFPGIPSYDVQGSTDIKFPAGWLIEKSGWKGFRKGDAGVHAKQALVLVNYGMAKGNEIVELSEEIKKSVWNMFGIQLETEVNIM